MLSATVVGDPEGDDELIARHALEDMAAWFPGHDLKRWRLLAVYRIPFSQFAQKPGIYDRLPGNRTEIEGLYLAGEYTQSSSIQGAIHSGEQTAKAVESTMVRA